MKISVALCVFNGARYLASQIDSIAAQTRPPDELVICDDGSSDSSEEIVREFARTASFSVRIERNAKNLGSTRNFEKAISLCQGDVVALSDQDDVWYPHKLERIELSMRRHGVVATFSDADMIDEESRPLELRLWSTFGFDASRQNKFANSRPLDTLARGFVMTGAATAFRRECFDLMTPIPEKQIHDAWISFLLAALGNIQPIPEPLMQYRVHGGQQIGAGERTLTLKEQTEIAKKKDRQFRIEEIRRFEELKDFLNHNQEVFPHAQRAQKVIDGKLSHLRRRAQLARLRIARIPTVLHETMNGAYWHYANGWKSAAKDLLLP
jgi:glycosyltransferase involved in cell wall biosynthesis